MKLSYQGQFDPTEQYVPGSIVRMPSGGYRVFSRDGWRPTAAVPDPLMDRIPLDGEPGRDGLPGKDGEPGQGFRFRGTWKKDTSYIVGDVVEHNYAAWVCTLPTSFRQPGVTAKSWELFVKAPKGERGERGFSGGAQKGARGRGFHWRGPWANRHYEIDDVVEFGGVAYIAVVSHTTTSPPSGEWNLFSGSIGGGFEPTPAIFDSDALKGFAVFVSSDGHVDNAIATAAATAGVVGICAADVSAANAGNYVTEGAVARDDWTGVANSALLLPGLYYYLSDLVAGQITSLAPTVEGHLVMPVGRAQTTTQLDVELGQSVLL